MQPFFSSMKRNRQNVDTTIKSLEKVANIIRVPQIPKKVTEALPPEQDINVLKIPHTQKKNFTRRDTMWRFQINAQTQAKPQKFT